MLKNISSVLNPVFSMQLWSATSQSREGKLEKQTDPRKEVPPSQEGKRRSSGTGREPEARVDRGSMDTAAYALVRVLD